MLLCSCNYVGVVLVNRRGSGKRHRVCGSCCPADVISIRTLTEWWSESCSTGSLAARPGEAQVKLWLQLAEQAMGLGESSPQFASIVQSVISIVRGDVLSALTGKRSVDNVVWFSVLNQCPMMANEVLFSWDEYNARVSDVGAVDRLARLPLLLCDVVTDSEVTMVLLKRAWRSSTLESRALLHHTPAVVTAVASSVEWAVAGVASALTHTFYDEYWVAEMILLRQPSLLTHPLIVATYEHDRRRCWSNALIAAISKHYDTSNWVCIDCRLH